MRVARSPDDLELGGDVLAVMHIEGAEAIDPGLELLPALHALGLRSIGPTWSRPNAFAHGVTSEGGLTDAGRALVRAARSWASSSTSRTSTSAASGTWPGSPSARSS